MKKIILFFVLFLVAAQAQHHGEIGKPLITTYNCLEIGMNSQVWDFVEDSRGVIYAGSAPGVFEFDGSTWRSIPVSNNTHARSIAIDKNDRIYVGASGDLGYLAPDETGQLKYISLMNYLDKEDRELSYVWTTLVGDDGIYFQTLEKIFRFTPKDQKDDNGEPGWKVTVWNPQVRFNFAFWRDNTYYVQQGGVGLMKMVNDSLVLLPGGEQFAEDRLQVFLPIEKDGKSMYLAGTFNRGLFLFDGSSFKPFKCEADSYIRQKTLYKGRVLPDGSFVFTMLDGGIIIIDKEGKTKLFADLSTGLPSNSVLNAFVDSKGLIWASPEGSVVVIEYPSPMTVFDASRGKVSSVLNIIRNKNTLYFSGTNGVALLDPETSTLKQVTGFNPGNTQSFSLKTVNDQFLVTHGTGLYSIKNDKASLIKPTTGLEFVANYIHQSKQDPRRIFIGLINGLASMYQDNGGSWVYEGRFDQVTDYVTGIIEPVPGLLWIGTDHNGMLRFDLRKSTSQERTDLKPEITVFNDSKGLPIGGALPHQAAGINLFIFSEGIYRFNESSNEFIQDTVFKWNWKGSFSYSDLVINGDFSSNIWIGVRGEVVVFLKQPDGSYIPDKTYTSRLSRDLIGAIYPEKNGIIWFGGDKSIYRFDISSAKNYKQEYPALIRKVIVSEDSVLFGGLSLFGKDAVPEIDYGDNSIQFEYSAISMIDPSSIEYISILEGFDEKWTVWKKETHRNYTNLPAGDYRFRVKAKNLYNNESREAAFLFTILPPWYSSIWAYLFYGLVVVAGIYLVDRFQRRRLMRKVRERARLHEIELRAETAEAKSQALQAENERRKNVELLSEIGRDITANLSIKQIIDTVYENVNSMMDAVIFGIGLYNEKLNRIDFPASKEKGKTLQPYNYSVEDENRPAVWCYHNQKDIIINDYDVEYAKYIKAIQKAAAGETPKSLLYLPLTYKGKKLGVITAQSFKKNSYTEYHLNILRNLATYTAVAIDNADAYHKLNETIEKLDAALLDLKATQQKLIVQEKLASLGQLTAGIAHEIKNPLNFVNNFAELSKELVNELRQEYEKVKGTFTPEFRDNFEDLLFNIEQNVTKTNEHGKRADSIVRSMLQHSRGKAGDRVLSDINSMLEEDLNLAYHGLRARDSSFNITIEKNLDNEMEKISIVPQDISRVFLNIINNGFYEAHRKKKSVAGEFQPVICVKTKNYNDRVEVGIRDNGSGIPDEVKEKLFHPFFTTKPAGEGTGLGLSLSHDIIVQHGGEIRFETGKGEYTEFIISLPKNGR